MIRSELKDPLAAPLGATHPHCFHFCHCSSSRLNPSALDKALPHDGLAHLFQADRGSRTGIKTALVEKLAQEGRDNLRLEAVVVDLPRTGAGEKRDTRRARSEREFRKAPISIESSRLITRS